MDFGCRTTFDSSISQVDLYPEESKQVETLLKTHSSPSKDLENTKASVKTAINLFSRSIHGHLEISIASQTQAPVN